MRVPSPLLPVLRDIHEAKDSIESASVSGIPDSDSDAYLQHGLTKLCQALTKLTSTAMQDLYDAGPGQIAQEAGDDGELRVMLESAVSAEALKVIGGGLHAGGWEWCPPPVAEHLRRMVDWAAYLLTQPVPAYVAPSAPFDQLFNQLQSRVCQLEARYKNTTLPSKTAKAKIRRDSLAVASVIAAIVGVVTGLAGFPSSVHDLTASDTETVDHRLVNAVRDRCRHQAGWSVEACASLDNLLDGAARQVEIPPPPPPSRHGRRPGPVRPRRKPPGTGIPPPGI